MREHSGGPIPSPPRLALLLLRLTLPDADVREGVLGDLEEDLAHLAEAGTPPNHPHLWYWGAILGLSARFVLKRLSSNGCDSRTSPAGQRKEKPPMFEMLRQHLAHAFRTLRRSPGFAAGVIFTMALGIGANTVMFGVVDRLLLKPPAHVLDPEEVRRVFVFGSFENRPIPPRVTSSFAWPDYVDLQAAGSFREVAAVSYVQNPILGRGETATRVNSVDATPSLFTLLGVAPHRGRLFAPMDDEIGAPLTAVLGYGLWQRRFGGETDVLGQSLVLDDETYTVIGIAPPGFSGIDLQQVDVWLPFRASRVARTGRTGWMTYRGVYNVRVIARLAPETLTETAQAEATRLHLQGRRRRIEEGTYDPNARIILGSLIAARGPLASRESAVVRWLAGVSLVVLLIACANVANLMLARASDRSREVAVRLALGISRARLVGQMVTEGVVLCLLGGAAALVLARWGADLVRSVILPEVYWHASPVEGRVFAFTALTAVVAGLVSAIPPALQASRPELTGALKEGGWGTSARRSRTRGALTIAQGSFSVVLLVGAGLFVRSLAQVRSLDLGMDVDHLAHVTLELDAAEPRPEENLAVYREVAEHLRRLPGVTGVGLTDLPFGWTWGLAISLPGLDSLPRIPGGGPSPEYVDPAHLRIMGIELLAGRWLQEMDRAGSRRVMVVNETMASTLWPNESALGQCVKVGDAAEAGDGECTTVVGVVENATRGSLTYAPFMKYYMPLAQASEERFRFGALYVRTEGDPSTLIGRIREEAVAAGPGIRYVEAQGLREILDPQARSWALGATMFSVFGVLALVVAAAGLYSLLAYHVARRTRELGVRNALGATRSGIVGLIMKDGVRLSAVGVALGLAIAWVAGRYVEALLFQVSPRDPLVFGSVAVTLLVVSLAASGLPAWRASRVDAMRALRAE